MTKHMFVNLPAVFKIIDVLWRGIVEPCLFAQL